MGYVDLNPVRAGIVARPEDYPWSGHRALRAEDSAVLDLSPHYLAVGPDAGSRYARYTEGLAAELARPAVSLAETYFVGRASLVGRTERPFGLADARGTLEREPLEDGLIRCGPRRGRPTSPGDC